MADNDAVAMFAASPVAMLATVSADGAPHLVPVVFAVHDDVVYTAVDAQGDHARRPLRRRLDTVVVGARRRDGIDPLQRRGDGRRLRPAAPEIPSVPTNCA